MKIIGKTDTGFIVVASQTEMERIVFGYKSDRLAIGDIVQISEAWTQLKDLAGYHPEADGIAKALRGLADKLTPPSNVVKTPPDEVT